MNPRPGLLACAFAAGCFHPTGSADPTISTGLSSTDDTATNAATSAIASGSDSTAVTASTSSSTITDPSTTTTGGDGCGDGLLEPLEECDDGNKAPEDGCSESCTKEFRRVFITSAVWTGDLGGLEGADQKCQDAADAAGLPGVYKAWLSAGSESPVERFVHSTVPYKQVDGVDVASDWSDLIDGTLKAGIFVSELNGPPGKGVHSCNDVPGVTPVWTGTGEAGTMIPGDYVCNDWSNTAVEGFSGRAGEMDSQWSQYCITVCQDQAALYCVEQ